MDASTRYIFTVTAVKNGFVRAVSHPTAKTEKEAIAIAKMHAIPGNVKGAAWSAELVREV